METKKIALTPRDKEIIFLVAKAMGFKSDLNSGQQITKDKICMLLLYLEQADWDKYNFHKICVAGLSFIRACKKVHRDIQVYIPSNLKAMFPTEVGTMYI